MSNIYTHFIRIYAQQGETLPPEQKILEQLDDNEFVPRMVMGDNLTRQMSIQFGADNNAQDKIEQLLKDNPDLAALVRHLWLRIYGRFANPDVLVHYDLSGKMWQTHHYRCLYGFDRIKVRWNPKAEILDDADDIWEKDDTSWEWHGKGSYEGANDRSLIFQEDFPKAPTKTSPTLGVLTQIRKTFPPMVESPMWLDNQLTTMAGLVDGIKFYWQDQTVQIWQRANSANLATIYRSKGHHYYRFCIDDWENCVSPAWIAFQQKQLQET